MLKTLFKVFGERKPRASEPKHASVTSYPGGINIDATIDDFGRTIRVHLELTRYNVKVKKSKAAADRWYESLTAYDFDPEAQLHENALRVDIYESRGNITLVPTYNGGTSGRYRGFLAREWDTFKCKSTDLDKKLGAMVRKALKRSSD